jgi:peptidoglycan hydrolase-like protein with peptidoglycan-binding domain
MIRSARFTVCLLVLLSSLQLAAPCPGRAQSSTESVSGGAGAWLGVIAKSTTREFATATARGVARGSLVLGVLPEGPAKPAGLRAGDVILRIGEHEVRDVASLLTALGRHEPGDEVPVSIDRDGERQTLRARLATPPATAGDDRLQRQVTDYTRAVEAYRAKDEGRAATYLKPLAEEGFRAAQNLLGLLYERGRGVPEDPRSAAKWYRLAAEQGEAPAQLNLGRLYRDGRGVSKDDFYAYYWLSLAASQGNATAAEARDRLGASVGPAARAEINEFIRNQRSRSQASPRTSRMPPASPDAVRVREVQTLLEKLGYDPGPADGNVGPKTRGAIRAFQESRGLVADGRVSPALVRHLEEELGRTGRRGPEARQPEPPTDEAEEDWEDLD